jgi:ferredoxin
MQVSVDLERCCGAGQCVLSAPDVFGQDDDTGIVVLLNPTPAPDRLADMRQAVNVCPAQAIALRDGAA